MKIDAIGKELGIPYLPRMTYFNDGFTENVKPSINNGDVHGGMGAPSPYRMHLSLVKDSGMRLLLVFLCLSTKI